MSGDGDQPAGLEQAADLSPRETDLHQLLSSDEAQLFCSASGEAPFEYDVHPYIKASPCDSYPALARSRDLRA